MFKLRCGQAKLAIDAFALSRASRVVVDLDGVPSLRARSNRMRHGFDYHYRYKAHDKSLLIERSQSV
jgi:hypothetical protein